MWIWFIYGANPMWILEDAFYDDDYYDYDDDFTTATTVAPEDGSFEFEDDFVFPEAEPSSDVYEIFEVASGETHVRTETLEARKYDNFGLQLEAGDRVTITVEAADPEGGLDTTLELFDRNDVSLGFNDDALSEAGLGFWDSQLELASTRRRSTGSRSGLSATPEVATTS